MSTEDDIGQSELLASINARRESRGRSALSHLPEPPFCSFCGRSKEEVGVLIEGKNAQICIECARETAQELRQG